MKASRHFVLGFIAVSWLVTGTGARAAVGTTTPAPSICLLRGRVAETQCKACFRVDCGGTYVGKVAKDFRPDRVVLKFEAVASTGAEVTEELSFTPASGKTLLDYASLGDLADVREKAPGADFNRLMSHGVIKEAHDVRVGFSSSHSPSDFLFQDSAGRVPWNPLVVGATHEGWRCDWADLKTPQILRAEKLGSAPLCVGQVTCFKDGRNPADVHIACNAVDQRGQAVCPSPNLCADVPGGIQ